jgi:hypothetical protein
MLTLSVQYCWGVGLGAGEHDKASTAVCPALTVAEAVIGVQDTPLGTLVA